MALSRSTHPISSFLPTENSTSQFTSDSQQLLLPVSSDHLINLQAQLKSFYPSSTKASTTSTVPPASHSLSASILSLPPPSEPITRPNLSKHHRQSTFSLSSTSIQNLSSLYNLAALALDKTTSAIAGLSEPSIRSPRSSNNLYSSAQSSSPIGVSPVDAQHQYREIPDSRSHGPPPSSNHRQHQRRETLASNILRQPLLETNPPSQAYADTASDTPPITVARPLNSKPPNSNKMHQTSSRLLRMTRDDRPYMRDFKDLFSTLIVSLTLTSHRVRLRMIEHSFVSDEAINNLGSLKFSQSNRMPDPKDTSRIVTTTTTTTFSMAREMARSVCQRFVDARFIESADGKQAKEYTMKGTVWQLTPKGIHILERFCSRNGIQQRHVNDLVNSPRNTMQLVILERDSASDNLSIDRSTIEVIFRRFIGQNGPNVKNSVSSADSDSLSDYKDGIAGVRMANERKVGTPPRTMYQTFTGKAATDWLMDCCTTVDRRETVEVARQFLEHELIWCVLSDRTFLAQFSQQDRERMVIFQPTKGAIYQMTQKGKDVVNMTARERTSESGGEKSGGDRAGVLRDSNTQKLDKILNDAALRLLFRENLRDTHCEENLSFYLDVDEFLKSCKNAIKANTPSRGSKGTAPNQSAIESVKETMASAYGIYNAFLAPGSPCELNIDHLLRHQLAARMTKAVGQDAAMIESLKEVTKLFEEAQLSVFKLMASDSVPKFMKSPKYEQALRNFDFDNIASRFNVIALPERSASRSNQGDNTNGQENL